MKIFTAADLFKFDGKNENPCYVGYKGLVYDVTNSFHWKNGRHWVLHNGGKYLTAEMNDAPHYDDLLLKFKVVGKLSD